MEEKWRSLYRIAFCAIVVMLVMMPIQIFVYMKWPPPESAQGFYALLQENWFLGLLSLDLLYILNNVLVAVIYLALYIALKKTNESFMLVALFLAIIGVTAYFPSNPAFEMLILSNHYSVAATELEKSLFLSSGETMLAIYKGTTFAVYYVLNAIVLLIISTVMLRSRSFSKATAYIGLITGALMIIPSTAGTIGLVFSLLSLIPWVIFAIMIARKFYEFGYKTY